MKKEILKQGSYYEYKGWYDNCEDELPQVGYKVEILPRRMSTKEILKEYNIIPCQSYAEGASLLLSVIHEIKNDLQSKIVFFKENNIEYYFYAYRLGDGRLDVRVYEVDLDSEWRPGNGVVLSNRLSDTQSLTLGMKEKKKPSEIFEGEGSSLHQAYQDAMTPDKKVNEYLERAYKVMKDNVGEIKDGKEIHLTVVLEIAKMIQLEEREYKITSLSQSLMDIPVPSEFNYDQAYGFVEARDLFIKTLKGNKE